MKIMMSNPNPSAEIILHLQSVKEILIAPEVSFYRKRFLNDYAEEYIIEEASFLPHSAPIILKVIIQIDESLRAEEIITAFHKHFIYRREKSYKQLTSNLR
jgi:hypothetical protein